MKIIIGNDHAGVELKNKIIEFLKNKNISYKNLGTDSVNSVDYPDYIHPVAIEVEKKEENVGIIICGSGNGAAMTANKHKKIRAALCWNEEISELAKKHNNANIISIPARYLENEEAIKIIEKFLKTKFEGERHLSRIKKIPCK